MELPQGHDLRNKLAAQKTTFESLLEEFPDQILNQTFLFFLESPM